MKTFVACIILWTFLACPSFAFAKDEDASLLTSAKKIASPKDSPLIPHIDTSDKKANKKTDTSQKVSFPIYDNEDLPKVASMPSKKKSLTDKIKEAETEEKEDTESKANGLIKDTWVEKLGDSLANLGNKDSEDDEESLELLTQNSDDEKKSNASVFDISGVMLRMTLSQAESALMKRGYKLRSQHFEIPNFIKWRYEEKCRDSGVIGYERLNSCVVKAAKEGNYQFVESARFSKNDSKEEIVIWLTSNFTKNKIYKIAYETGITGINRGSSAKIAYLRNVKVYEFWHRINQKYGNPDNKDDVLWGLGPNKPYMKAATGRLLLEDPMLRELDYTRMSREDQKFMNTNLYNF